MSTRGIRGPLQFHATEIVLVGNLTIVNQSVVVVKKSIGAATTVTLPASSTSSDGRRRVIYIIDGKGDSATNAITIARAGSDTINAGTSYTLATNYGVAVLVDCGSGIWQASTAVDPTQAQSVTNATIATLTSTNATITTLVATTANATTLNVAGITTETNVTNTAALGTVIGNAAPITAAINIVTGANDTVGVVLPAPVPGKRMQVYNQSAAGTNGLKIYPPVNSNINNGTANAAIVVEGWTLSEFIGITTTTWACRFTVNA